MSETNGASAQSEEVAQEQVDELLDLSRELRQRADKVRQEVVKQARKRDQLIQSLIEGTSLLFLVDVIIYGLGIW